MGRHLIAPTLIMTDVSSKPLAGFKTTARVVPENRLQGLKPLQGFGGTTSSQLSTLSL
ncbi:MAG: hypothetical protein LBD53_02550 [Tannerella sp.]|nr:hypothetical protein [Tannerella sp.]